MVLTAQKIAVTVNSRQHQGISVPKHKIIRTVFVAQYGSDVFCSGNTKISDSLSAIRYFSFKGRGQRGNHGERHKDREPRRCLRSKLALSLAEGKRSKVLSPSAPAKKKAKSNFDLAFFSEINPLRDL